MTVIGSGIADAISRLLTNVDLDEITKALIESAASLRVKL